MDAKIRAVVADDEALARERICTLLRGHDDIEIVGECADGGEAVRLVNREPTDLLFLDVQMPVMDGFDVVREVHPDRMPAVVFVTAHDDHALEAFEIHALDFLLKPFDQPRFEKTLARARVQVAQARSTGADTRILSAIEDLRGQRDESDRLVVRSGRRVILLRPPEIDWIEADGNYVRVHVGEESHVVRETMQNMEKKLDPKLFVRINRAAIVNFDRIAQLEPLSHGEYVVVLRNRTRLTATRVFGGRLKARIP
jgi:two-component system LytT family response regulator